MKKSFALAASLMCVWSTQAQAAYLFTFAEVNGDVVTSGSGSLNITGLQYVGNFRDTAFISSGRNIALIGGANESIYNTTLNYSGVLGSSGALQFASSGTGGLVGVLGGNNQLAVPIGYVSGSSTAVTSLFAGQTFASLGLTPGTVTVGFNTGANLDTITFQIGSASAAVPEPATWALLIGGMGATGFSLRRRRAKVLRGPRTA